MTGFTGRGRFSRAHLLSVTVVSVFLALEACSGGGGGGGVNPTPAPNPTPTPTPVPTPTPTPTPSSSNNTAEYRATVGAVSMNALVAYDAGASGAGVRVGIIDSGIDISSAEFGSRISSYSRDVAGNATIDDEDGHGTAVAFTIGGRRNDVGSQGVAYNAELVVLRADSPGSCAAANASADTEDGCSFYDDDIADGIDAARLAGVRVINISLGGGTPSQSVLTALSRATAAGIVVVISAGNDGPDSGNPDSFAAIPANNSSVSNGLVIIAGSVGTDDMISDFSNVAGSSANTYLTAVGESVRAPGSDGTVYLWSGTSFSAPQIAGAVALLAQAFPNLTGADIVSLLYATARDAGATGTDSVYGRGVLDLTRAFQPVGTTSLAGSRVPASQSLNASLSAPMGDADTGTVGAVVLDGFNRAFAMELADTIRHQAPQRRLEGALSVRQRSFAVGYGALGVAVTIAPGQGAGVRIDRLAIGDADAGQARAIAATVTGRLGAHMDFAIGASESGTALVGRLAGRSDPAFLIARDPATTSGFESDVGGSFALRRALGGGWGLTMAMETGDVVTSRDRSINWSNRHDRFGYARATLGIDRRMGGLSAGFAATRLAETDTVLGARFADALGGAGAESFFVDGAVRYDFGAGWSFGGSYRRGWTRAVFSGAVAGSGTLGTSGFSADIGKRGLFGAGDRVGMRVAQPLRVETGGLNLLMPGGWDYAGTSVTDWTSQRVNLTPRGREIDLEFSYAVPILGDGEWSMGMFLRRDPGHYADMADDMGGMMRVSFGF